MNPYAAFISSFSPKWIGHDIRRTARLRPSTTSYASRTRPTMIQRPDQDGPPDLEAFFDNKNKAMAASGKPITLGTGRALLQHHENDIAQTCLAALSSARQALPTDPQLIHCTFSLDFDANAVAQTLQRELKIPILGRSVNKKESSGTIEILALSSDDEQGISFGSVTSNISTEHDQAFKNAATEAATNALNGLASPDSCTFMLFCHSPGADNAVRAGLDEALPGVIAYGGPAIGDNISGDGWALLGGDSMQAEGTVLSRTVHVATVPGSLSFLYSAVIKNWAQPAYTEPLSYMTPSYLDDPHTDLLTAIRYNDWEKFIWCLEKQGINVNATWTKKQNQSPLLAACARVRTEMIKYLLDHGADVGHRNDGGFTATMYTRMLSEYDRPVILNQLKMLEEAGADTTLTEREREMLIRASSGRIVE